MGRKTTLPSLAAVLLLSPQLLSAHAVRPQRPLPARDTVSCSFSTAANSGQSCSSLAGDWGLSVAKFEELNPGVDCVNPLSSSEEYCVLGTVNTSSVSLASSTTTPPAATSPSSAKATAAPSSSYEPQQSGVAANCDAYCLVKSGDTCAAIEDKYGISASDFAKWNPSINSGMSGTNPHWPPSSGVSAAVSDANRGARSKECTNLLVGYYVCVDVKGHAASETAAGATPTPHQTGMAAGCDKFYKVVSGDTCDQISKAYHVSESDFISWNPAVGKDCGSLWVGDYVCVDVKGHIASKTTAGHGIATPTPYEPGMVSSCNKFFYVKSGDSCSEIAKAEGISVSDIESWNPKVGSRCTSLWADAYICVGVQ